MSTDNNSNNANKTNDVTDFGYQRLPAHEKTKKVADVFHSVASRYDLMNDVMSLGLHRLWKRTALSVAKLRPHEHVLDLAGGTADLTARLTKVIKTGRIVLSDINASMLEKGRCRLLDQGIAHRVQYVQADAESLPFPKNTFDCIIVGFGLRNVTHKERALDAMFRVLKPGGRALILEFSTALMPGLSALYEAYSFKVIPKLGQWITGDSASYRYLVESIRKHPDPVTLECMMQTAGFEGTDFHTLSGGIVAIHRGYKY